MPVSPDQQSVVIVTGAAGGIGTAIVEQFLGNGAHVIAADVATKRLDALHDKMTSRDFDTALLQTVAGDVADPDHHRELIDAADGVGGATLSVLNAGVYVPGLSWDMPLEHIKLHVDVNLWGVIHGVRAVLPGMIERGQGHVIGVSSGAGLIPTPGLSPYVATKHGVVGFMESVFHELNRVAPEVHASVVCPGNVQTPMAEHSFALANVDDAAFSNTVSAIANDMRSGNQSGADAATVAAAIAAAVDDHRFWILPQPEIAWAATDRMNRLQQGEPPADYLG